MTVLKNGMYYDVLTHRVFKKRPRPNDPRLRDAVHSSSIRDRSFSLDSGRARRVVLILTERCNLACSYCYAGQGAYGKGSSNRIQDRQINSILSYLERVFPLGIENLQFFGGEPLLEPRAIRSICERSSHYASIKGSSLSVVTNGTVLSESILQVLTTYHVAVTISLDGPAKFHDLYRVFKRGGHGSFKIVTRNIERMASAGVPVAIQLTVSPTMVDAHAQGHFNVDEFSDLLGSIGVRYVHLSPVIDVIGGEFSFSEQQLQYLDDFQAQIINALYVRGLMSNAVVEAHQFLTKRECNPGYCGAGLDELTVDINGDLYPCFMFINQPSFRIGTISEGVTNIALVGQLEGNRKAQSSICSRCEIVDSCKACVGARVLENGTLSHPSTTMCHFLYNNYFFGVNELVESIRHE